MVDKVALDDDELDAVTGGVFGAQAGCSSCSPIDSSKPNNCDNCNHNSGGFCPCKM